MKNKSYLDLRYGPNSTLRRMTQQVRARNHHVSSNANTTFISKMLPSAGDLRPFRRPIRRLLLTLKKKKQRVGQDRLLRCLPDIASSSSPSFSIANVDKFATRARSWIFDSSPRKSQAVTDGEFNHGATTRPKAATTLTPATREANWSGSQRRKV